MKTKLFTDKKILLAIIFVLVAAIASIMFVPSITAQAAYSGQPINGNLHWTTMANTVTTDRPTITFLTHGLGGSAGHWSNSLGRTNETWGGSGNFSQDSDSIIEKIRSTTNGGIKLYVAESISSTSFNLWKEYSFKSSSRVADDEEKTITDFSLHTVVVFDISSTHSLTNEQLYDRVHYIIDKISYDYYVWSGGTLPRLNLIGHSRGGLVNMDYAINHPKNIASLVSLGTPYNGSWYDNDMVKMFGITDFESTGGMCITGTCGHSYYYCNLNTRKNAWNNMIQNGNNHIGFHVISGTFNVSFMNKLIMNNPHLEEGFGISRSAADAIRAGIVLGPLFVPGLNIVIPAAAVLMNLLPGDICVDYDSQQADGYGVSTVYGSRYNKEFGSGNCNWDKRAEDNFPVPHNLETYDSSIHAHILEKVVFAPSIYTENIGSNQIKITQVEAFVKGVFTIPEIINGRTVTVLGPYAFFLRTGLTSVIIPNGVTTIENLAFHFNENLTSVTIPSSVTTISDYAFTSSNNKLTITASFGAKPSGWGNNWNGGRPVIWLPSFAFNPINNGTSYEISLGTITDNDIVIPSMHYGLPVTKIADNGFAQSVITSVTFEAPSNVQIIGNSAFANCNFLFTITLPSTITTIGNSAFANCTSLGLYGYAMYLPSSVTSLGSNAFQGCTSLTALTIPNGVTRVGTNAFADCIKLAITWIYNSSQNKGLTAANFSSCLKYVNITGTSIVENAFANSKCHEFIIPDSISFIALSAFSGCNLLEKIEINTANQYYSSQDGILYNKAKTSFLHIPQALKGEIVIPNGITTILDSSFANRNITKIALYDNITYIGYIAFSGCGNLENIDVTAENDIFSSIDGVLFNKAKTELIFYPLGKASAYVIPNSVTTIKEKAFLDCELLTDVTIPDSVINIEKYAFYDCSNLENVVFGSSSGLKHIGEGAFSVCESLTSIKIPSSVTNMDHYAFFGCLNLTSIIFEQGSQLTKIESSTFAECSNLISITIPSEVEIIGEYAFFNCSSLKNVNFEPNSRLTGIGNLAFTECVSLESITIPESVNILGNYVFVGCKSLTEVTIPSSVTYIGEYAFFQCSNLTTVNFGPDIYLMGILKWTFAECNNLTSIIIPSSVNFISEYAFFECIKLKNVDFESNSKLGYIGIWVFALCESLESIKIPNLVGNIDDCAFNGCISLTEVILPSSLQNLGDCAFFYCINLTSVITSKTYEIDVLYGLGKIGSFAFAECWSLENITVPSGAYKIEDRAFYNCKKLKNIIFEHYNWGGWKSLFIEKNVFVGCNDLRSIIIPQGSNIEANTYSATIYVISEAPTGSDQLMDRSVIRGCKLSEDETYIVSFINTPFSISNIPNSPYREGYVFAGWYDNEDYSGTPFSIEDITDDNNKTYYAKWI